MSMQQQLQTDVIKEGLTHPTIHVDYYSWFESLNEEELLFVSNHSRNKQEFHAIAMWAWTMSRESLKKKAQSTSPTTLPRLTATTAWHRYARHDMACPLSGNPIQPGDERCTCGLSAVAAAPDPLLQRGIEAAEGALVLADCYFDQDGRDGYNNDNYCRLIDWLKEARQESGTTKVHKHSS